MLICSKAEYQKQRWLLFDWCCVILPYLAKVPFFALFALDCSHIVVLVEEYCYG